MEDHDFMAAPFKWIKWAEHPEIIGKIRDRFKEAGILELLAELDHIENEPNLNEEIQAITLKTIRCLIAVKLDLYDNSHAEYLSETLPGYIEENDRQIKKLEKRFKKHRHDKDKSFSSVPV